MAVQAKTKNISEKIYLLAAMARSKSTMLSNTGLEQSSF